jgi:transposase
MESKMKRPRYYLGIDISSEDFTVSVGIEPWKILLDAQVFENSFDGFGALLTWMGEHQLKADQTILCMEATGVYGEGLAYFLNTHDYRLAIEPPLKVKKAFMPHGHKNDRVDSRQIAEYSYRFYDELRLWRPREEILEQIKVLLSTREQFTSQKTAHRNALKTLNRKVVATPLAEELHRQTIHQLEKSIQQIEAEIQRLIDQDPKYGDMIRLLMSIPGVGFLLASNLLLMLEASPSDPPNPRQLAAHIGICPYEHRSGRSVYHPSTSRHYGPAAVRKLLYLASLSLRTHNAAFEKYFLRKVAEGKPKKVVLNNIANKLLKIICAVVRTQTPYIPGYRSVHPALLKAP